MDEITVCGVEYVKVEVGGAHGCNHCDCAYSTLCRLGGRECKLYYSQCYKVKDESKKIKEETEYTINGTRYIAKDGHCKECAFYNYNGCKLTGLTCTGHIPLKEVPEGGV